MTNMRKTLRNRKALSPVVASIILIAVTVAVSIAVAAWIGAIPGRYMTQPQLSITTMTFPSSTTISLNVTNTGTAVGTVTYIKVNGNSTTFTSSPSASIKPGDNQIITVNFNWQPGYRYMVELYSQSGELLTGREEYAPSS
jgi:flagellin-like protein